jgi:HD superfamily phosphodiesterase
MATKVARTSSATNTISGVGVPDSKLAREITEFIRDTETELLFNHSSRVYYFGALAGNQRGLTFDSELLYTGAMFHDIGLMPDYSSSTDRFEVDGANAARDFLKQRGISQINVDTVWTAIALHTTPGVALCLKLKMSEMVLVYCTYIVYALQLQYLNLIPVS